MTKYIIAACVIIMLGFITQESKAQQSGLSYPDTECLLRHQDMIALVKPTLPDVDEKTWTTFKEIPVYIGKNPQGLHFCALRFIVYINDHMQTSADTLFVTSDSSVIFVDASNFNFQDMTMDNMKFLAFQSLSDFDWQNILPIEDTFSSDLFCRNHEVVIQAKYAWMKYTLEQANLPITFLTFAWARNTKMEYVGARMLDSRIECGYKYTGKIALQQRAYFSRYDNGQFVMIDGDFR